MAVRLPLQLTTDRPNVLAHPSVSINPTTVVEQFNFCNGPCIDCYAVKGGSQASKSERRDNEAGAPETG